MTLSEKKRSKRLPRLGSRTGDGIKRSLPDAPRQGEISRTKKLKVCVIGPGALGCLFAARLAQSGLSVTLADYRPDRAERLKKSGIVVESSTETIHAQPAIVSCIPEGMDVLIVLVKAYSTPLLELPKTGAVLTLQNGLGNAETLAGRIGSARLLAGTTSEGATLLDEGRVRHAGRGRTVFGAWTSCPVEPAYTMISQAGFDVEITESPGQCLWQKAAVSAGINPLTALLDVPNGQLLAIREARQLMRDLVVEAAKVAGIEGYRFKISLVELAEEVCRQTAENISSMLQDVRTGRRTEIDAISGEILQRAQAASLPTPRTRMIWQLIKSLEQRRP